MTILFNYFDQFFIDHPRVTQLFNWIIGFITNYVPIISAVLFPFYVIVYQKNRKRDEKAPIFFITDYFYKTTVLTETLYIFASILILIVLGLQITTGYTGANEHVLYIWAFIFIVKENVTFGQHILTSFLALQRFLLYFFPRIGNFLTPSKKVFALFILIIHSFTFYIVYKAYLGDALSEEEKSILDERLQILQIAINLIELLGALPYFLMILSIRKLTNLSSNTQSKPEVFIKYQIVIIFISKLMILPFLVALHGSAPLENRVGAPMFLLQLLCESLMAPLMIQMAYLLSNKTHWDTLKQAVLCCKTRRVEGSETANTTAAFEHISSGRK